MTVAAKFTLISSGMLHIFLSQKLGFQVFSPTLLYDLLLSYGDFGGLTTFWAWLTFILTGFGFEYLCLHSKSGESLKG